MVNSLDIIVDGVIYQLQPYGGISRIFDEILPRMCAMDDTLKIRLLTNGRALQGLPCRAGIKHYPIPQLERYLRPERVWGPLMPWINERMREAWIKKSESKIWHSTYYTVPCRRWDGASVITVADMIHEKFASRLTGKRYVESRYMKKKAIENADAIIAISETTRSDILDFYNVKPEHVYVTHLACSPAFRMLDKKDRCYTPPGRRPFLLYVGDRLDHKNVGTLINAYRVWNRRDEIALVFVGRKDWTSDERKRLAECGLENRVYLLTDIDDEALNCLYNQALALVYPSLYEGFGIPLLEAMSAGCPIIASRIDATLEVAGDIIPVYFDPLSSDDLVRAFDAVLSEGKDSKRVKAGREKVNSYSWDRTAAQTLDIYKILSNKLNPALIN